MAGNVWRAFVDGGCHPNPEGKMGIGVVLYDPQGNEAATVSESPPKKGTNNEAEYIAVLRALQTAHEKGARDLEICADSKLTVNTMMGRWRLRAPNLVPLKKLIDQEEQAFRQVLYRWVPREKNTVADRLATEAIGGDVTARSKYGGKPEPKRVTTEKRPLAEGALCGACKQMCTFEWQVFKNGSAHIRQSCPEHGFLRYAPRERIYEEVAGPEPT